MKAVLSLLALAASALAANAAAPGAKVARGGGGEDWTTTEWVWTTTTVCPYTSTITGPASTYEVTTYITSTVTVTSCGGGKCGGGGAGVTVTIPGPTETETAVDTVWYTTTSLCPVSSQLFLGRLDPFLAGGLCPNSSITEEVFPGLLPAERIRPDMFMN
jgi:hypothetical protein